jgi:hypothetical protein
MTLVNAKVDPTDLTKDLSGTRTILRNALKSAKDQPDEILELMPLTPLVPKRLVKKVADLMIASDDKPVVCSNMGDLPSLLSSPDGTEAEYTAFYGVDQATGAANWRPGTASWFWCPGGSMAKSSSASSPTSPGPRTRRAACGN